MADYRIIIPDDFEDDIGLANSQGYYEGLSVDFGDMVYRISFYEPVRLAQYVSDTVKSHPAFYEMNLVVVDDITLENMEKAIEYLSKTGQFSYLVPG